MEKYEHRRRRLLELKDWACEGKTARLAERIERSDSYVARMLYTEEKAGRKRIGDDMLDVIESAFGLIHGWFDLPLGTPIRSAAGQAELTVSTGHGAANLHPLKRPPVTWPFPTVSHQRVMSLKSLLGPKVAAEAMRDIDSLLDVAVAKWEKLGKPAARKRS